MLEPLADLERHAAERPSGLALATSRRTWTYEQLQSATIAVAARLEAAGIGPDDIVAVDLPVALEFIVDLALFRLATRSMSIRAVDSPGLMRVDALITSPGRRATETSAVIEVDELWVDAASTVAAGTDATPAPAHDYAGRESIFRLILTSGTTGIPRAAAYSVGAFDYRMAEGHVHWSDGRPELTMIGLSTTGGFHAAMASLRHGVPYLAIDRIDEESLRFAAAHDIEVLCGSPSQVARAIQVIAGAAATERPLRFPALTEVRLAGAGPSPALLHLIVDTFGVPVRGVYGSTEGGGISQLILEPGGDRFEVGAPLDDVELEVVDEHGAPVPEGVEGAVRYRTPGLVSGYLEGDSVVPFTDGWFVPGDTGTLGAAGPGARGSLTLAGRDSELFNLGGIKVDPVRYDDLATAFPGVVDAAAFPLERTPGIPEVGLAVVGEVDMRALDRELRERMPVGHPTAYWRVGAIPRTRLGKPLRARLTEDFGELG